MNERNQNCLKFNHALGIAMRVHGNQLDRGGNPYILHCINVAASVEHLGLDAQIVGLLHDAIEDTPVSKQMALLNEIDQKFGRHVTYALIHITRFSEDSDFIAPPSYAKYIENVAGHPICREVKLADIEHNIDDCDVRGYTHNASLASRYEKAREVLEDRPRVASTVSSFNRLTEALTKLSNMGIEVCVYD